MNNIVIIFILLYSIVCRAIESPPIETDVGCSDEDLIGILFLNGVQNTAKEASDNLDSIIDVYEANYLSEDIPLRPCYKLLYNQDDGYGDFAEVLAQKIRERYKEFSEDEVWDLTGKFIFTGRLFTYSIGVDYYTDEELELFYDLNSVVADRIKNAEVKTLNEITRKTKDVLFERPAVLVSHSQGNLFGNLLFNELQNDSSIVDRLGNYANLQVATPANNIAAKDSGVSFGDYVTSRQDWVINPIGVIPDALLPSNLTIDNVTLLNYPLPVTKDKLYNFPGHSFSEVYTNSKVSGVLDGEISSRPLDEIFYNKLIDLIKEITASYINEIIPLSYEQVSQNQGIVELEIIFDKKYSGKKIRFDYGDFAQSKEYILDQSGRMIISSPVYSYTQIQELSSNNIVFNTFDLSAPTVSYFSDFNDVQYFGYYESDSPYIKPHIEANYSIYYGSVENQNFYSNSIDTRGEGESSILTLRAFCKIIPDGKIDEEGNPDTLFELRDAIVNTVVAEVDSCNDYYGTGEGQIIFRNQYDDVIGGFTFEFEDKTAVVPND